MRRAQLRFDEAITEYETLIAVDRNDASAYADLGQCKFYNGLIEEYIPLVECAIRLSPRDRHLGVWLGRIGLVHLLQSRITEAILWLESAQYRTGITVHWSRLASAYALNGEIDRAVVELAEARNLRSDYSSLARFLKTAEAGRPKIRALLEATYFAGLRKAGMQEE